jgi:signal transduction histidine kinase
MYDTNRKPVRVIGAMQDVSYEREEEKRITRAILDAQEKERHQIGLELHDNVNQILVGTLLNLGMINKVTADKAPVLIEKSKEYIVEAIGEIRKLSHRLAPANFENISLKEIFEGLIKSVNVQNAFEYKLVFEGFDEQMVSNDIQVKLLRILQEQLSNIVKYASASFIEISVIQQNNRVSMRIFDNGAGFNPALVKRGIGLGNIKKRAESLKGKFLLNSTAGNGCEIIIEIPLPVAV